MISRRQVVLLLGAGALAVPSGSFAQQQGRVWRIGILSARTRSNTLNDSYFVDFLKGMRDLGYVEGKNVTIEWRFGDGNYERMPELAAQLVRLKPDIIVTAGTPPTKALQRATTTIPIVMATVTDPVGSGLIASLARPGGNITGLSNTAEDISTKLLEHITTVIPKLSRVAVLLNPASPISANLLKDIQIAAKRMKLEVVSVNARTPEEIESAFAAMKKKRVGAVIVTIDIFFGQQSRQIAELALKNVLPLISNARQDVERGYLVSYGRDVAEDYRHAATYVDKILKGAKPADLPVEQPTVFELVVNLKTAKALGIAIPQTILLRADRVIE